MEAMSERYFLVGILVGSFRRGLVCPWDSSSGIPFAATHGLLLETNLAIGMDFVMVLMSSILELWKVSQWKDLVLCLLGILGESQGVRWWDSQTEHASD